MTPEGIAYDLSLSFFPRFSQGLKRTGGQNNRLTVLSNQTQLERQWVQRQKLFRVKWRTMEFSLTMSVQEGFKQSASMKLIWQPQSEEE